MFEDLEWLPTTSHILRAYSEPSTDSSEEDGSEGEDIPETKWSININKMPLEIICDILEIASDDADNSVSFVFCASLVCKYWKALTFSAPKLWGRLDAERPRDMIKNFLKRSNRAPLDIWIYLNPMIDESEGESRIRWFTALIALERYRFRSLTFHYYYPSWFEAGSSLLTSQTTIPIDSLDVRRLQFSTSMGLDDTAVDTDQITLIPRRLRYDGMHLSTPNAHVPLFSGSLISLDLRWPNAPTCIDLLFSGASSLEYLRLAGIWYSTNRDRYARPPQRLQSLREVVLDGCDAVHFRFLFYNLETPSLERLLLELDWDDQLEEALATIGRQNPQLRRLHIKFSCRLQRMEWKPVFSALPSLTHLSLSDYGDESVPPENWSLDCLIADSTSPQSALCPNLSSIVLNHIEGVSPESVVGLVKSRMAIPGVSPIKSLKWAWLNWHEAADIHKAIGGMVPDMVLECVDMATLKDNSEEVMLLEEEWVSDDWDRWSDTEDG